MIYQIIQTDWLSVILVAVANGRVPYIYKNITSIFTINLNNFTELVFGGGL